MNRAKAKVLQGCSKRVEVLDLKVYEVKRMPALDPYALSENERNGMVEAFKILVKAVDERIKIEDELDVIKSKSKKEQGLFEDEIR